MAYITIAAMLALTQVGAGIDAGCEGGGINLADMVMQALALALVFYVTQITRRLDKEVHRGGE